MSVGAALEKSQLESTLSTLEVFVKLLLGVHVGSQPPHNKLVKMCIAHATLEMVVLLHRESDTAVVLLFLGVLG